MRAKDGLPRYIKGRFASGRAMRFPPNKCSLHDLKQNLQFSNIRSSKVVDIK